MASIPTRRVVAASAAVLLSASLLSACSGSGGAKGSGGGDNKQVVVGLSSVLSGPYAAYSDFSKGAKMYFDEANKKGVNGHTFKYIEKDNGYTPAQSIQAFRALAAQKAFVIIPAGTPVITASRDLAKQLDVPIVGTADGDLFTPPQPTVFDITSRYTSLARFDAKFIINQLKTPKFALAYEDDSVGLPALNAVPSYAAANGGTVLAKVPIDPAGTDYSPQAQKLKDSGATVVQGFIGTTAFAGLQKACAAINYKPKWVTLFTQLTPAYPALAGTLSDGVYADSFLEQDGPALKAYQDAAAKDNPKLANSFLAQLGWSAGAVVAEGVKDATDGGQDLTKASFVAALSKFNDVSAGLLPAVTYNSTSHAGPTNAAIYQYNGTSIKKVLDYSPLPDS